MATLVKDGAYWYRATLAGHLLTYRFHRTRQRMLFMLRALRLTGFKSIYNAFTDVDKPYSGQLINPTPKECVHCCSSWCFAIPCRTAATSSTPRLWNALTVVRTGALPFHVVPAGQVMIVYGLVVLVAARVLCHLPLSLCLSLSLSLSPL
jgi:hypothetical protein